jgi:hypothetical protein
MNPIWEYLGLIIYPVKPPAGLFILIKSHETIPSLSEMGMKNFFLYRITHVIKRKLL